MCLGCSCLGCPGLGCPGLGSVACSAELPATRLDEQGCGGGSFELKPRGNLVFVVGRSLVPGAVLGQQGLLGQRRPGYFERQEVGHLRLVASLHSGGTGLQPRSTDRLSVRQIASSSPAP